MIAFVAVVWAIDVAYEFTINVFLSHVRRFCPSSNRTRIRTEHSSCSSSFPYWNEFNRALLWIENRMNSNNYDDDKESQSQSYEKKRKTLDNYL